MRRGGAATAAMITVGLVVLAGCASGGAAVGEADAGPGAAGAATAAATPTAGPGASNGAMDDAMAEEHAADAMPAVIAGADFDVDSLAGTDAVLWFWAPWCPTCQRQAGLVNEALPQLPDGVEFIGVAGLTDSEEQVDQFIDEYGVTDVTHVVDLAGDVWRHFEITSQSTFVFLDDSGMITVTGAGTTVDEILTRAEELAAS